jgi:hypothetical protein
MKLKLYLLSLVLFMAAWVSYTGWFVTTAVIQQVDKVGLGIIFLIPILIIGMVLMPFWIIYRIGSVY